MVNKIKLFGIIALVAIMGFSVIGCSEDDDDNGGPTPGPYDGTWSKGTDRLVLSGTNYTFRQEMGGTLYDVSKGTFSADFAASSGTFFVNQTHLINSSNGQLEANPRTETGSFSNASTSSFTVSGLSYFSDVNGTWTK